MFLTRLYSVFCTLLLSCSTLAGEIAFTPSAGDKVIRDVTLISGDGSPPQSHYSVVLRGENIAWVGPDVALAESAVAENLPVAGSFVMPGLIDSHAHMAIGPISTAAENGVPRMSMVYDPQLSQILAEKLLHWGVTTARNPAGPTEEAIAVRDAIDDGRISGPRVYTAGEVIDRGSFDGLATQVTTADEVRREVARQAELGVDFIKLYQTLPPELLLAGIDAAHERGLRTIGHLMLTDWGTAADMGIDSISHMLPASPNLLPEAARADYLRGISGTQFMFQWFEYADLDSPEIAHMIESMANEQVFFDPTLVAVESLFFADTPRVRERENLEQVPVSQRENWRSGFSMTPGWSEEDFSHAHSAFDKTLQLTYMMYRGGVPLTAGSDLSMPWIVAGDALHRELELLVMAGIPPLDVITMATTNAARALGVEQEIGSVASGKRADLLVLAADPTKEISNTRRILLVFQDGKTVRNSLLEN